MNHGCLHIHPFCLILLSVFTGVCRLQSRMFMVLSCHVLCSLLSYCGVKEGIDYVENWGFFFLFAPNSSSLKDSGHEGKRHSLVSASSSFAVSIHTHQVSWAFRGRSADLLWSWVYPTASRFANVENRKLNPESPNLRFVLCFSNVNIKGQKSAKQGLSEWVK